MLKLCINACPTKKYKPSKNSNNFFRLILLKIDLNKLKKYWSSKYYKILLKSKSDFMIIY